LRTQLVHPEVTNELLRIGSPKVVVVLPTCNEADNIIELIPVIRRVMSSFDLEIVVVDDGSWDGTAAVARDLGAVVVRRREKNGLGSAVRKGVQVALECGGDIIVQMDADWQHVPQEILSVIDPLLSGKRGFVLGCRKLSGQTRFNGVSVFRRLLTYVACFLANLLLGVRSHDPTSGFRAFDRRGAEAVLKTVEDGYAFQVEALCTARRMGLRIAETAVSFESRARGESKLDLGEILEFMRMLFRCFLNRYAPR
jgi:dolichol-phosphate mannosyltransferase